MRDQDLNDLCGSVTVMVGDSLCPGFTKPFYGTDRLWEQVGRGGFTIFPYIKGLEEEFTDGETIVFYKFGDFNELKRKIDYYIDPVNADERERIRKAGQAWVRENATYHNRLQEMLDIVFPPSQLETASRALRGAGGSIANLGKNLAAAVRPAAKSDEPLRLNLGPAVSPWKGGLIRIGTTCQESTWSLTFFISHTRLMSAPTLCACGT